MTDLPFPAPALRHRLPLLPRMLTDAPGFTRLGLFLTASLAATLAASLIDTRLFQGENIWGKPVKFQIALAIYTLTLAAYARWLPEAMTGRTWWRAYSGIVIAAIVAELIWIGGAAAAGTASHFNVATPALAALYAFMGAAAVTLTSATLVMGIAILRNPATGLPRPIHLGLGLGLILTFVATVIVAGTMSSGTGHLVGTASEGARGLWPFGWSREAGDLRVAHFLAAHALHAIPLAALIAAQLLPERTATRLTLAAALAWTALVAFTFLQALNGLPFLPALG